MIFLQNYKKTVRTPNFTLRNQFSYATIEQTADSKEDNQCGDDEGPDVGDSRGDGDIVRVGNQSLAIVLGQYVRILTVSYIYITQQRTNN